MTNPDLDTTTTSPMNPPAEVASVEGPLTLRDGAVIFIRAIRPDDTERLRAFHAGLSFDTIIFRFFRVVPALSADLADRLTHLDYDTRMALIATASPAPDAPILAVARYDQTAPGEAEVAFVVHDAWQGRGIATQALYRLAGYARPRGYHTFVAITMASNARMLDVLRNCGFPCVMRFVGGDIEARLDISAPPVTPFHVGS